LKEALVTIVISSLWRYFLSERFTALTVLPSVPPHGGAARMPEQLEDEGVTVHPAQLKVEEEATVHPAPPHLVVLPVNHVIHMAVHQSGKL
jgi:hypothetical protein